MQLPPDVSFKKEKHPDGWAYVFRHARLGKLGRILLQGLPDGRTNFVCEMVEDHGDPLAKEREAIFKPLSLEILSAFDRATGGSGITENHLGREDFPRTPERNGQMVKSKMMQCRQCDAPVALLIFADDPVGVGGLEDYARLMHLTVVKHDLPTWVIGPPSGMSMDAPSDILKIWPEREILRRLSANEFNPILDQLTDKHCS